MAMCPGDTTVWEDLHRKNGNFAPKKKEKPQRKVDAALVRRAEKMDPLSHCQLDELDQLEDEVAEDTLVSYRKKRMAELKASQSAAKFGQVLQVTRTNFVQEVTEGSANGQWVLVLLYVDAMPRCHCMMAPWEAAARRFPAVKFMRGVASEVVENFPDDSTPTVLFYHNEDCPVKQLTGLDEWGGSAVDADSIEWALAQKGVVETEMEEDPRHRKSESGGASGGTWRREHARRGDGGDSEQEGSDDEDDDRCYSSMKLWNKVKKRT